MFDELMVGIKAEICQNTFRSASSLMAFEQFFRNLQKRAVESAPSLDGAGAALAKASSKASDMVTEATEEIAKAKPVRQAARVGRARRGRVPGDPTQHAVLQNAKLKVELRHLKRELAAAEEVGNPGAELGGAIRNVLTRVPRTAPLLEGHPWR